MKKLTHLIFIFALVFSLLPQYVLAQTAASACSGISTNNRGGAMSGNAWCVDRYTACIDNHASGSTCSSLASAGGAILDSLNSCQGGAYQSACTSIAENLGIYQQRLNTAGEEALVAYQAQVEATRQQQLDANGGMGQRLTTPGGASNQTNPPSGNANGNLSYVLLEPFPGLLGITGQQPIVGRYIDTLFKVAIGIGVLMAVGMLIFGGLEYMVSEAAGKKMWAAGRIRSSLWGLLLLLASVLILTTINPQLTNGNALFSGFGARPPTSSGSQQNQPINGSLTPDQIRQLTGTTPLNPRDALTIPNGSLSDPAFQEVIDRYTKECSGGSSLRPFQLGTFPGDSVGRPNTTIYTCTQPSNFWGPPPPASA